MSGAKIKCSGQSDCKVSQLSGNVRAVATGQSKISISGENLIDIEADASGQSKIVINGDCRDFEADASGQSEIFLLGHASGRVNKNTSGSSEISTR